MPFRDGFLPFTTSKTLAHVALLACTMGLYACLPLWKERSVFADYADMPSQFHAALSLILGWLLVFRTNTAYNRWWEARTLWGSLVNCSRNMAVKVCTLARLPDEELPLTRQLLRSFPHVLRSHLRDESIESLPADYHGLVRDAGHSPLDLIHRLYRLLAHWKTRGFVDGDEMRVIDEELRKYLEICGACERIQRTPIVKSYRFFARQCVLVFLLTLPWGIVGEFGVWTIPLTMITAYFMLGLEIVAEHVEEPFGYDEDDLDLDGMCLTIEQSVHEVFETHANKRVNTP